MKKKVLIITYYWPPSGGSGVQRWLKFVKYLQSFDIEPIVFTVDNPSYAIEDHHLESEVPKDITILRKSFWEPNKLINAFKKGKKKSASSGFLDANPSTLAKIARYIRANYFIPDARKYWIKPSTKYLTQYLKTEKVDLITSSGPPHSTHIIAMNLKEKTGSPWISDFRDPWTEIDYFKSLPLTAKSIKKHELLEKSVLKKSDAVIVIGETMKNNFLHSSDNIHVITNGFDDSNSTNKTEIERDKKFSMSHIGLMNSDRNPIVLWKAISEICKENIEFKADYEIQLIGKVASEVDEAIKDYQIENISRTSYVPHEEVQILQKKAQILLLCVNRTPNAKGIITGKIFEYLEANRPIIAIGPRDGDLAEILRKTEAGSIVDFDDVESLKNTILELYKEFKTGDLIANATNISQYHRKSLTGDLAKLINDTLASN